MSKLLWYVASHFPFFFHYEFVSFVSTKKFISLNLLGSYTSTYKSDCLYEHICQVRNSCEWFSCPAFSPWNRDEHTLRYHNTE